MRQKIENKRIMKNIFSKKNKLIFKDKYKINETH
jgi:hypothetical protein